MQGPRRPLLACMSVTLSLSEITVEKCCHTDKNSDTRPFCLKKKLILSSLAKCDHPYFHHITVWVTVIACSVIRKNCVSRYSSEHIYLLAVSGILCCCMRIFQVSLLMATWDKKSLVTEILFTISVPNVGAWTPSCGLSCWKILWFITLQLQMFPASLLWNAEFLPSMSCHLCLWSLQKHSSILYFFLCCRDGHCLSAACLKHKWMVVYICLALSTFPVLSYLGCVLLTAID